MCYYLEIKYTRFNKRPITADGIKHANNNGLELRLQIIFVNNIL